MLEQRSGRGCRSNTTRGAWVAGALCALGLALTTPPNDARAQPAATLDGYRASPLPSDAFVVSGADPGKHLELSLQLHADYANDPLVFEDVAGRVGTERVALVSDQLTLHPSVALGLFDAASVFIGMPVHLVMTGQELGQQPTGTGFGAGDFGFGGRLRIHEGGYGRVALQLTVTLPTGEAGSDGRPGVAGDAGVTTEPRVAAELKAGPLELLLNAGMRFREDAAFAGARFSDVFTYGVALRLPMLQAKLTPSAELFGEAPIDDVGDRTGSPLQGLLGVKLRPISELTLGLSGGAGLLRGYGAPDARLSLMIGYALPLPQAERDTPRTAVEGPDTARPIEAPTTVNEDFTKAPQHEAPEEISDRDHDGVADIDDRCPAAPGMPEQGGCPQRIEYDEESGAITFLQALRFEERDTRLRERDAESLAEVLALLGSQPQMKLRVEAHLTLGRRGEVVAGLQLSAARAVAVAAFLIERGVSPRRLEAYGCAANRPLVPDVGSQRFKNERVELYVIAPLPASGIRSSLGCIPGEVPGAAPPKALGADGTQLAPARAPQATAPAAAAATPAAPAAAPAPPPVPKAALPPPVTPAPSPAPAPVAKPTAPAPATPAPRPTATPVPPASAPPAPHASVPPTPPRTAPAAASAAAASLGPAASTTAGAVAAALARDPKADADADGVPNGDDRCPLAPRSASGSEPGCPEGHNVDLTAGRIELTKPMRFEDGQSAPSERSTALLDELAATLRANPSMRVLIEAHVAEESAADASLSLTRARAAAVRSALVARGIPQARLRAYGCGQTRPVAPNNVPWGRKRNERVELHLLDPAPAAGIVHSPEACVAAE